MWLLVLWGLVGLPKVVCNFFLSLALVIAFFAYKLLGLGAPPQASATSRKLQEQLERQQQYFKQSGRQLGRKIKDALMGGRATGSERHAGAASSLALATCLVTLLLAASTARLQFPCVYALEQDAEILMPVAGPAKALIKTVTLGVPLEFEMNPTGLARNFAYFTWRTGFPLTMPRSFVPRAQEFGNRVRASVSAADVTDVERKALVELRQDLDDIVDSIVAEVGQSPHGLYTNYLQAQVRPGTNTTMALEEACVAVGTQLKAYGVDLANYRNIAGMVLGLPVMPTVASTVMNVHDLASLGAVRNLTTSSAIGLARLPGSALGALDSLRRQQRPVQSVIQAPLSLLQLPGQQVHSDVAQ